MMMCEATQEFTNYITSSPALKSKAMQEFTFTIYDISISAMLSKSVKEMQNQSPREREQASEKYDNFHLCIYL